MPWPSRCWQRKREPSGGLAGSQDPVCLEQGLEPGGHFSLQGLTAQPSRREHVNTSRAGQRAGREEDTRRPQLLSPVAALDSSEVAASSYLSWACGQALPSLDRIRAAGLGEGPLKPLRRNAPSWGPLEPRPGFRSLGEPTAPSSERGLGVWGHLGDSSAHCPPASLSRTRTELGTT